MTRLAPLLLLIGLGFLGCAEEAPQSFASHWSTTPDRNWAGPDYWANRLQDWQVRGARLECTGDQPMRTVHLLTRRLAPGDGDLEISVQLGRIGEHPDESFAGRAGFLIGAGAGLDYRAAALIHHSYGSGAGTFAGIGADGGLFFRDFTVEDGLLAASDARLSGLDSVTLRLSAVGRADGYVLELSAISSQQSDGSVSLRLDSVDPARLVGNLALVCDPASDRGTRFWFRSWLGTGTKLEADDTRAAGPVIGSQHTLSRGTLKLTAQLMPVGSRDARVVELQIRDGAQWMTVATAPVVVPGYTATFRLDDWDDSRDTPYRVAYTLTATDGTEERHFQEGVIRRDPKTKEEIVVAAFTGNHNAAHPGVDRGRFSWDWGIWFPHSDVVAAVASHRPDLLFFSGDQVYEGASPTRADYAQPYEDYLYKWYLWSWAFRDLTANIPTVTIPDDHDVYHGNIWGAGGIATPPGLTGAAAQDAGGYKLPPDWVNMVQRTQTSHLPDPYDPAPVHQGIGVYYTELQYGGVSFAVIEDRKFKSAPAPLLPEAQVWNGWPQDSNFDPKAQADVPGAALLGSRQLAFLEDWASDWSAGTWMKVLLSQTIFANVATLPDSATSGSVIPSLEVLPPGGYAQNEKTVSDMDSNGWPQSGRDAALRIIRKGFAVHIAGDQHLGSTIQYGVDEWGDAAFALCVPSVANFWPRRWFPPAPGANRLSGTPRYTGDYEDGFGNKMTVYAISNPHRWGKEPSALHDRAPGYGIAGFNRTTRNITFVAWPRWADPTRGEGPYPDWPVTFTQTENYGRRPVAFLPTLKIDGLIDPVVQIVSEDSGQVVYTLRIRGNSFTPHVFESGSYTIRVGEPGTDRLRTISGLRSTPMMEGSLSVSFE